jgi:hypothetical protein
MPVDNFAAVPDGLTLSSPLLAEAAGLLTNTTLLTAGLPTTDSTKEIGGRADFSSASDLSQHVAVVSTAAPDVAVAAPNVALVGA